MKKITKMTSTNQSEKTNKRKIAMLTIFLVVLCILGLSTIRPSYADVNHSSVTMKDVALQFNVAPTAVSLSVGTVYQDSGTTVYCVVPVNTNFVVYWTAPSDGQGWVSVNGQQTTYAGNDVAIQNINIADSYTMQVTPT